LPKNGRLNGRPDEGRPRCFQNLRIAIHRRDAEIAEEDFEQNLTSLCVLRTSAVQKKRFYMRKDAMAAYQSAFVKLLLDKPAPMAS